MTALRDISRRLIGQGSPIDLLHVENLPTVGLLLCAMAWGYVLFRRKWLRWGPDVDLLLAEKDRQITDRDERIGKLNEAVEKWTNLAWNTAQVAKQATQTSREAARTVRVLTEQNGPVASAAAEDRVDRGEG